MDVSDSDAVLSVDVCTQVWKDKFKQERCAVYQACFLLRTHVCKKDSSPTYDLYLKEPEENYKMPTGERWQSSSNAHPVH